MIFLLLQFSIQELFNPYMKIYKLSFKQNTQSNTIQQASANHSLIDPLLHNKLPL